MAEVTISRFDPEQAAGFSHMTYPAYRHLLDLQPGTRHQSPDDTRPIRPLAVAARIGQQPVGLALAEVSLSESAERAPAELLSLYVEKGVRGRGVGKALLAALEQLLGEAGETELRAVYMQGKASIKAVEQILASNGWSTPEPRMVTVKFMVEELYKAKWLHRYPPRPGYELFSWMDLKPEEREEMIRSHEQTGWIEPDLLPWDYDQHEYEPVTSVGLRFQGKVVGWVINHRLADDTVRYTCSFVRKDLQRVGAILPLYCESFRRLHKFGFQRGMFVAPLHHPRMAQFARRWFGPWSYFTAETMGCGKRLASGQSEHDQSLAAG